MRYVLAALVVALVAPAAGAQTCYGGSYSNGGAAYGYSNGNGRGYYSDGFERAYSFGSYGVPQNYAPQFLPEPAVYESRTPYGYERPQIVINFDQRGRRFAGRRASSFAAPSRTLFDARVRVGARGYCPGGY